MVDDIFLFNVVVSLLAVSVVVNVTQVVIFALQHGFWMDRAAICKNCHRFKLTAAATCRCQNPHLLYGGTKPAPIPDAPPPPPPPPGHGNIQGAPVRVTPPENPPPPPGSGSAIQPPRGRDRDRIEVLENALKYMTPDNGHAAGCPSPTLAATEDGCGFEPCVLVNRAMKGMW